jgi:hypothetical protein
LNWNGFKIFGFFDGAGFKRKANEPHFSYIFTLVSFEIDATVSRGILSATYQDSCFNIKSCVSVQILNESYVIAICTLSLDSCALIVVNEGTVIIKIKGKTSRT